MHCEREREKKKTKDCTHYFDCHVHTHEQYCCIIYIYKESINDYDENIFF
jgi:hypothetical protein